MSTTYAMPTFGTITNIFSTSTEEKDVSVYKAITWYNQGRLYTNSFQVTEITPKIEGCSILIVEQKPKVNQLEDSFQVYLNGNLQRESFKRPAHKAMMDFITSQYLNCNLPAEGEEEDYQDVKAVDIVVPSVNPFA